MATFRNEERNVGYWADGPSRTGRGVVVVLFVRDWDQQQNGPEEHYGGCPLGRRAERVSASCRPHTEPRKDRRGSSGIRKNNSERSGGRTGERHPNPD